MHTHKTAAGDRVHYNSDLSGKVIINHGVEIDGEIFRHFYNLGREAERERLAELAIEMGYPRVAEEIRKIIE